MNTIKTLQAKFKSHTKANEWIDKKMDSGKWINGKITIATVQAKGGENLIVYFANVQNARPPFCPYTRKPIGQTKFVRV